MIYAYIRVSGQSNYDKGLSLSEQKNQISEYCFKNQIEPPQFITEPGAVSGFKSNRPGLNKLTDLIMKGKARTVILYDLSRLSRDLELSSSFLKIVRKKQVKLIILNDQMDVSTTMGKQNFQMKSMMNEWYRDSVSQRMLMVKQHMKEKGMFTGGKVPYGFDVNEKGLLIDNESEQEVLGHIIRLKEQGWNYTRIVHNLKVLGVPTKTGKKRWSPKVVRSLYLNYTYEV